MSSQTPADAPRTLTATLLTALLALVFGFLGAAVWSYSGLADNRTRTFLLANPDLLPQMAEAFEAQEAAKRLTQMGGEVFTPFPGVVLGNPQGKTVLVEFTDYNCPYCEASLKDVNRLIAETEGNIDRGYAYEEVTVYQTEWVDCTPRVAAGQPAPPPQMCLDDVPRTERKAVAIDLVAEAAKLDSLKAKRAQQSRAASSAIAA